MSDCGLPANVGSMEWLGPNAKADACDPRRGDSSYEASMLLNLLARIHRDGGHYVEEHGLDKALEDADAKVVQWLALGEVIGLAYGHLWMVNNEPGTPRRYPTERAAYEARKLLRDTMTNDERGVFINRVIAQVSDLGA